MGAVADAQARAQGQGLVDGSTGWPSVREFWHDSSDQLVGFFSDGGPAPGARTGNEYPRVQVRVRGGSEAASDAAKAKLRAIRDDLHGLLDVTIDNTRYMAVHALGEVVPMGPDEQGRPEFTQTFEFRR